MRFFTLIALFVALALTPQALELNNALDVEADTLDVLATEGRATFSGNVILAHEDMTLTCESLVLQNTPDNKKVAHATATKNVVFSFQDGLKVSKATGDKAVWNTLKNVLTITGNVKLVQNQNTLTGTTLTYNLNTKKAKLSSSNSGRVKAVFTPSK